MEDNLSSFCSFYGKRGNFAIFPVHVNPEVSFCPQTSDGTGGKSFGEGGEKEKMNHHGAVVGKFHLVIQQHEKNAHGIALISINLERITAVVEVKSRRIYKSFVTVVGQVHEIVGGGVF